MSPPFISLWTLLVAGRATDVCIRCYDGGANQSEPIHQWTKCHSRFSAGQCGPLYPYKSFEECEEAVKSGQATCSPPAWRLCLHTCKDDEGKVWIDQVCSRFENAEVIGLSHVTNWWQVCPRDQRADCQFWERIEPFLFLDTKDGKTPEQQCKEFACDSGAKPWNALDHTACKGGPVPKPSPSSGRKILAPKKFGHQCLVLREDRVPFDQYHRYGFHLGITLLGDTAGYMEGIWNGTFQRVSVGSCDQAIDISFAAPGGAACVGQQANCSKDCLAMVQLQPDKLHRWVKLWPPMIMHTTLCHLFPEQSHQFQLPTGRGPIIDLTTSPKGGPDYCLELQPCRLSPAPDSLDQGRVGAVEPMPEMGEDKAVSITCEETAGWVLNSVVCSGLEDQIFEVLEPETFV